MTKDEWKKILKESFPDEIQGYTRSDTVPSDAPYMEEFPPFIVKDKVVASLTNLVTRQMLSNDKQLKAGYESADANINKALNTFKSDITAKRATTHMLTLQGDVTGSATFNNDSNITVTTTDRALATFKSEINKKRSTNHTLTLKGDVTGSATFNNDSNITVTTTDGALATFKSEINKKRSTNHTLTLKGDVTGSATFNNDSNITVTTTNQNSEPVGVVQWYAGWNLPDKYILCDGSEINRNDYAQLFAVIGTTYGAGNGSTTFNLPNLIGRFAEGATSPGSYIGAGLPNIWGRFSAARRGDGEGDYVTQGAFQEAGRFNAEISAGGGDDWGSYYDFNAQHSNGIYGSSDTVQPPALCLKPIIRYAR